MLLHSLVLLCLVNVITSKNQKLDYCAQGICPYQGVHVRCNNSGDFAAECRGDYKLIDLNEHIELILQEHNTYRNIIASGELKCFKPAARMPELYWNSELAENAAYNVKTCVFAHDKCRSTEDYPFSGQNIYFLKTRRQNLTVVDFITEAIFLWFNEQKDCDYTILESFHKTEPQTGHFCMLVNDRNTLVGCAMLLTLLPNNEVNGTNSQNNKRETMVIFTCNYTSTNIRHQPSYKPGPSNSECKTPSQHYSALCADSINVNDMDWYYDN